MTEKMRRKPLSDWRWWAGFALLVALAFSGGWVLYQVGLDSGAAGAIASAPLFAFAMLTIIWRKHALNPSQQPRSSK